MKRILVIGCPGSGKSVFSKRLAKILNYPILHLDRIFHINNNNQISRDKLKEKIVEFVQKNDTFIIDGNYTGTLEYRLRLCDIVFYFDIDESICLRNVIKRIEDNIPRDDIAPGFDNSIMDPEFIKYVKTFNNRVKSRVDKILEENQIKPIKFFNYDEVENFFINITKF